MTEPDENDRDRARDEVMAAEYALGVLSFGDRKRLEARMEREPAFSRLVTRWEDRLTPLEDTGEERPPAHVYPEIESRLFGRQAAGASVGWWQSLALWRGLAFASLTALVATVSFESGWLGGQKPAQPLVAEMTGENSPLTLLARYDVASGRLDVTPVAADAGAPRSLQLWMVPGGAAAPVPLGVLPQDGLGQILVPADLRARIADGMTLAVSVEPAGGSPTGAPTGPVIAAGQARHP